MVVSQEIFVQFDIAHQAKKSNNVFWTSSATLGESFARNIVYISKKSQPTEFQQDH